MLQPSLTDRAGETVETVVHAICINTNKAKGRFVNCGYFLHLYGCTHGGCSVFYHSNVQYFFVSAFIHCVLIKKNCCNKRDIVIV